MINYTGKTLVINEKEYPCNGYFSPEFTTEMAYKFEFEIYRKYWLVDNNLFTNKDELYVLPSKELVILMEMKNLEQLSIRQTYDVLYFAYPEIYFDTDKAIYVKRLVTADTADWRCFYE